MRHAAGRVGPAGPGLAPRAGWMEARRPPPLLTAAIATLLFTIIGFWGYVATDPAGLRIAHIARTRARLNDAVCVFSADVMLRSRVHQWTFERRQLQVRAALVDVLRTKSRYMVSTPVAREALRSQMLRAVNRVMEEPVADELRFTEFVLS